MKSKLFIAISALIIIGIIVIRVILLNSNRTSKPDTIILISIDTIRADHLSCYGYQHKTTPVIDAFAQNAILFSNCFANVPLTLPSHASILSGVIPPTHGVHDNNGMKLSDSVLILPEILKENGYATYGVISAMVLNKKFGLAQGFDVYDDTFESESESELIEQRFGAETAAHAVKWLEENQKKKKFMFIHFFDPHKRYLPPAPYDKQFKNPYDGEIAFTDYCIGRIIDKLKSLGLYDDSLIIITGDHGEMLGEHGESTHSYYIYQNALRVPLIIKPAHHLKSFKVTDNTSLIDIMPTVLSQSGIQIPSHVQGLDLSDYFVRKNHHIQNRYIFNESLTATKYNGNSLLGVINDQWHYIQTTRPELYNRVEDPQELNNLIGQKPQIGRILQDKLRQIIETFAQPENESRETLSAQELRILESLGYVAGAVVNTDLSFDQTREDPKDLLRFHRAFMGFSSRISASREYYDGAINSFNQILKERPGITLTYDYLAISYIKLESYDKAIDILQKKLAILPEDTGTLKHLAHTYNLAEDYSQAIDTIKIVLKLKPGDDTAYDKLAEIYTKMGKLKDTAEQYETALRQDPDHPIYHNSLAWIYATQKDPQLYNPKSALIHAEKAVELSLDKRSSAYRYYPNFLDTLATAQAANGQFEAAIETANRALKLCQEKKLIQLSKEIQSHLALFKQHRTYRE